jgi:hypothetical protein
MLPARGRAVTVTVVTATAVTVTPDGELQPDGERLRGGSGPVPYAV